MFKKLFKRVLVEKQNQHKTNQPYEITCPYCFEKFDHEKVHFRASAATNSQDPEDPYRRQTDKELNRWSDKFRLSKPDYQNPVIRPEEEGQVKDRNYVNNVLMEVIDYKDNKTSKRLCPHCHNELPVSAGRVPIVLVSVIGTTKCGKSVFLASLINQLLEQTAFNMNAALTDINQVHDGLYEEKYHVPLFQQGVMLEATNPEEPQMPLIYEWRSLENPNKQMILCFFDVAGEVVVRRDLLGITGTNIRNSDALLFLIDPLKLSPVQQRLELEEEEDKESYSDISPSRVIKALIDDFINLEEGGRTTKPTAIVLTKSDRLHSIADDSGQYLMKNSNIFQNAVHEKFFDLTKFGNIDGEVRNFIRRMDPKFLNQVVAYFNNVGFFAVSALGNKPIKEEDAVKVNGYITPYRIDEPILWALYKMELIEGRYSD